MMITSHNKTLLGTLALATLLAGPAMAQSHIDQGQHQRPLYPSLVAPQRATIELVFVLDTTGSMGGMLEGAKTRIWGIVNDVLQRRGNANTQVKVGLVAYRDRGDAYITKITPLSSNLDAVYAQLMSLRAEGGGDGPEDVRSAMADALRSAGWSSQARAHSQIMFLVGDAPPHDDYQGLPSTTASARLAQQRGIIVNTVQCGNMGETTPAWRSIAQFGGGEYFAIAQDGGVDVITTPYDQELAKLGEQMGATYMAYGASDHRARSQVGQAAMESSVMAAAPAPARAERALNKALNTSAYDESDLVQKAESNSIALPAIAEAELPDALRKLEPAKRQAALDKAVAERKALRERIVALSKRRDAFVAERRKDKGAKTGFDAAVSDALARQVK
jgi:Mg-chelatase subunit ChlD